MICQRFVPDPNELTPKAEVKLFNSGVVSILYKAIIILPFSHYLKLITFVNKMMFVISREL